MKIVTPDVLLYLLDRDWAGTVVELFEQPPDFAGLAVALTYGTGLPQGREFGSRRERTEWLASERAKRVRSYVIEGLLDSPIDEETLVNFVRQCRKRRGYGRALRRLVREWHAAHSALEC